MPWKARMMWGTADAGLPHLKGGGKGPVVYEVNAPTRASSGPSPSSLRGGAEIVLVSHVTRVTPTTAVAGLLLPFPIPPPPAGTPPIRGRAGMEGGDSPYLE